MRLATRFVDLRKPEAFGTYLDRMIVNASRSYFRSRGRERSRMAAAAAGPIMAAADVPQRVALWAHLDDLPHRQRAALVLRFYADLTEAQAAEVLGCPVGTVKSLVSRGLSSLREAMAGE